MILVVLEHDGQTLRKAALEAITRARQLSALGPITGLLIGDTLDQVAAQASQYLPRVLTAQVTTYTAETWAHITQVAAQASSAQVVIAPASRQGRSWTGRLAQALQAALLEDTLDSQTDGTRVMVTRYSYLNRVTEQQAAHLPVVLTAKPNTTALAEANQQGQVEALSFSLPTPAVEVLEQVTEQRRGVSLGEANLVVTGGRGLGSSEAFGAVQELADLLGGAVGATRAVVDAGWRPYAEQVGQTGKTVQPQAYLALAVSGAVQHQAGMNKSRYIVAVNKDAEAPIFRLSDYGIVGDVHQVLPALIEAVRKLKD
jgi:electron transfer flavoprotein alpha subunit